MSNKKEVVVCAAIRISAVKDGLTGSNVIKGVSYEAICEDTVRSDYDLCPYIEVEAEIKGFITNHNRFISPEEALLITGRQNEMRFQNRKYLLPEDLY